MQSLRSTPPSLSFCLALFAACMACTEGTDSGNPANANAAGAGAGMFASQTGGVGAGTGATGGTSATAGTGAAAGTTAMAGGGGMGMSGAGGMSATGGTGATAGTGGNEDAGTSDAGMSEDAGEADAAQPDAGGTEGCPGDAEADFALVGWATQAGGTSGGRGGTTLNVANGAQLAQALKDKQDSSTPLTLMVTGTITQGNSGVDKIDVKDVQDVSIIGAGSGAEFDGIGIKIVRAKNIVIRNLRIHNVAIGDKDGISIEGPADHIWIDHCELYSEYQGVDKDYYDGLIDAKAEAQYITYSWNHLHDSWKTMLVGSSESDTFDRKLTIHHNHFENCNSRLPLFRGGNGHVFNNYYEDIVDTGINARIDACLKIEGNYFEDAHNPWVSAFSDVLGGGDLECNVTAGSTDFEYSDDVHELPSCNANVPYSYDAALNKPDAVPDVVKNNAGVGKLANPAQF